MDRSDGSVEPRRDRNVRWIDRPDDLSEVLAGVGQGPLAVDTEADSFHHYRDKVCLIQLSFGGIDVLVDPLAVRKLEALRRPFERSDMRKILHGSDYDVRMLERDFGLTFHGLFDTMVAARLVGERAFGLQALLDKFLNVRLEKRFQRADWSRRPLTRAMLDYAVLDTRHLEPLAEILERRLRELGRLAWAEEEFRQLEAVRWNPARQEGSAYLRIKGIRRLQRAQLAILCELAQLRESVASRQDVPPFRVMRDEVLIDLVHRADQEPFDASEVRGLPARWTRGSDRQALVEAIRRGRELPESEWPRVPRSARGQRLDPAHEALLRRLAAERDRLAESLGLEPAVLAPRSLLTRLLERTDSEGGALPGMKRWQAEVLGPAIRTVLG